MVQNGHFEFCNGLQFGVIPMSDNVSATTQEIKHQQKLSKK